MRAHPRPVASRRRRHRRQAAARRRAHRPTRASTRRCRPCSSHCTASSRSSNSRGRSSSRAAAEARFRIDMQHRLRRARDDDETAGSRSRAARPRRLHRTATGCAAGSCTKSPRRCAWSATTRRMCSRRQRDRARAAVAASLACAFLPRLPHRRVRFDTQGPPLRLSVGSSRTDDDLEQHSVSSGFPSHKSRDTTTPMPLRSGSGRPRARLAPAGHPTSGASRTSSASAAAQRRWGDAVGLHEDGLSAAPRRPQRLRIVAATRAGHGTSRAPARRAASRSIPSGMTSSTSTSAAGAARARADDRPERALDLAARHAKQPVVPTELDAPRAPAARRRRRPRGRGARGRAARARRPRPL